MSKRKARLEEYKNRLPYSEWLRRLKAEGLWIVNRFIERNDHLSQGEFEMKVQRMFLDKPKPNNWTLINQVLVNVNAGAHAAEKTVRNS